MKCPKCGNDTKVTHTRYKKEGPVRYRKCNCGHSFRTLEIIYDGWLDSHYKEKYEKLMAKFNAISSTI